VADVIQIKSLDELVEDFLDSVEAHAERLINRDVASFIRALAFAASMNDSYIQAQNLQVAQNSRLDTATGDGLDTWVEQYSPPFETRTPASAASSGPVAPTTLTYSAKANHWHVVSKSKLLVGQVIRLKNTTKTASATVAAVEPTTTLTVEAGESAPVLNVASTTPAFVGGTLLLTDGNQTTQVVVTSINSSTQLGIEPLTSSLEHVFAADDTVVTFMNVIQVGTVTYDGGAVLGDFTSGTSVIPRTMLEGVKFSRVTNDGSTPTIRAKTDAQTGVSLQTRTASLEYEVVPDPNHPNYDVGTGLYTMPAADFDIYVKVQAKVVGKGSNIMADTLVVLPTPVTGIDAVTNPYAIENGTEAETDAALRTRFRNFISSRDNGTFGAVSSKIEAVQTGLIYTLIENVAPDGVTDQAGHFVVVISNEDGELSSDLYDLVYAAINASRPLTSTFSIFLPTVLTPSIVIVLDIDPDPSFVPASVRTAVQEAIYNSFLGRAAGEDRAFNSLIQLVMAVPGVQDIVTMTIDGNGFDNMNSDYTVVGTGPEPIVAGALELVRPGMGDIDVT
jgi:hypothetical protein